ncbi:MAG: transmembrane anchor protein [bacterium]|nr:transmembrane anchor protein [bacterium]
MFNSQMPPLEDLPTSRQLLRSTLIAIVVAFVVLIAAVLPAEYGVDPTGIGSLLGLKNMGDIKVGLGQESTTQAAATSGSEVSITSQAPPVAVASSKLEEQKKNASNNDVIEHTLAPGEAVEYKLEMKQGAKAQYKWTATNGKLNHDTHGDGYKGSKQFVSYKKGRMVTSDEGELEAAFDGHHGWFWRNRDKQSVSVKLETSGDYIALKRAM